MNKFAVTGIAVIAIAVIAGFAAAPSLSDVVGKIHAQEALTVTLSATPMGGSPSVTEFAFAKPNKARIDNEDQTIVADGNNMTVYMKKMKKYYTKPQSEKALSMLLTADEMRMWTAFFNKNAFNGFTSKAGATVNRKGKKLNEISIVLDAQKGRTLTLMVDPATNFPAVQVVAVKGKDNLTTIIETTSIASSADASAFVFKAPKGADEVAEADLIAVKWYSFDEALAMAKTLDRKVYVHFTADWCGWCRKLENESYGTEEFKNVAKNFVLCQVDTDKEPEIAQRYGVGGIPDLRVLDKEGNELAKMVGYRPTAQLISELEKFK
ncbi:MAG: thioredoxin family protein [Chthonomonas sp.]|nr:thioredoxin family protein [Chthonomonas sp.]